jgi:hypothetical protein
MPLQEVFPTSFSVKLNNMRRRFNPETQGAVSRSTGLWERLHEQAEIRATLEEEQSPGAKLEQGISADWYGGRGSVSVEGARDREQELRDAIDGAVEDENKWGSNPGRVSGDDDAPCRVQKKRWWG